MSRRQFDLYVAEHRAEQVALVTILWIVQHGVLGWFWATDRRDSVRRRLGRAK